MSDRCDKCLWAEIISSQDGWSYVGCTHEPYDGKWVRAIKDCPKKSRLIDADYLIAKWKPVVNRYKGDSKYWETAYILEGVIEGVENAPTVEAEPVRHGHWVRHLDTRFGRKLNDTITCSCCGIAFSTEDMIRRSYCPNCGAKMDEEEK